MYAEPGLLYPFFHRGFTSEVQYSAIPQSNGRENPLELPAMSEFNLGGEDLFMAPGLMAPILEEPMMNLDPMFANSLFAEEDIIPPITDIAPVSGDPLFGEDFFECKKALLAKSAIEESLCEELEMKLPLELESEVKLSMEMDLKHSVESEVKLPPPDMEQDLSAEKTEITVGAVQKSTSSGCLTSMEWVNGGHGPKFLDFGEFDLGAAIGLRRAHSEGDIQTLSSVMTSNMLPQLERLPSEGREIKLLRYRNKKAKRNYGRKIKYACRKALADSQPRVRGRFARTEEAEVSSILK